MKIAKKLYKLLNEKERKEARGLLLILILMAIVDMIGVASIMPFMGVLTNPEIIERSAILNSAYNALEFESKKEFLLALGLVVFALLMTSLGIKALAAYKQAKFTLMQEFNIGERLAEIYLNQSYEWFLSNHSSNLGKNILSEVNTVIGHGLGPFVTLIAQSIVAVTLFILLLWVDVILAITTIMVLGGSYTIVYAATNKILLKIGDKRLKNNEERFKAINEAFSAIKDIKVKKLENIYIKKFSIPAHNYAVNQSKIQIISQLPRFGLEGIAFGGMLIVTLYTIKNNGDFSSALPIIALYAFAGYRLMPALQQIYGAATQIRYVQTAINDLHEEIETLKKTMQIRKNTESKEIGEIRLENVTYTYPKAPSPAIKKINILIRRTSRVGIIGKSGSGKSTTVDIILGLIQAQQGDVSIAGINALEFCSYNWSDKLGYVPQQIYLSDGSIAENIAIGLKLDEIDINKIIKASKLARLHEFIINQLPEGYETKIGERGVRLSGGQRQRIGIARALYNNPQLLILDEATSALDTLTEMEIIGELESLKNSITIIIISHRLESVKNCDNIYLLERGEIKAQGTYENLKTSGYISNDDNKTLRIQS